VVETDSVRVDVWLWAVRVFRTRTASKEACRTGKVRVDEAVAKPATKIRVGGNVSVRVGGRRREFRVQKVIVKRVGAEIAATCYEDLSPPPEIDPMSVNRANSATGGVRDAGAGRPTKRDRRRLDRFRRPPN